MNTHGLSAEGQKIKPRKILVIGTLGSGKTTVAQRLARDTGFPYASIDECRIRYGDGTVSGEERAWENFLAVCRKPASAILEFCGMGPRIGGVRDNLLDSAIPVSVIWLVFPLDTCIARASRREKKIPAPYEWAPVAASVPLIHDSIEFTWDTIWREPGFHATRQEFRSTTSVEVMYSVIRESLHKRNVLDYGESEQVATAKKSELTGDDIMTLEKKVKAGIQKHYKSKSPGEKQK